ncbi:integrase, catalytic region, zinc finger, CCHC-type containing protein [Tanacetum coccineum]
MAASSPVCLMSKATSTKSLLWHRRLSHLSFGTINDLTKHDLVDGLPKFKYCKDHFCSACERGKSKKSSHPPKLVPSTHFKLELLHMDLCGPIRVESINGKRYILVIVDDYSRFTWAEAIFAACFTQNRSIIHKWYNKTPYELLRGRKPNVEYFHVLGSLCYPTNDRDDLGKMKPKADIGIFIGLQRWLMNIAGSSEPGPNQFIKNNSSVEPSTISSKEDLDNLFCLMFKEYFEKRPPEVSINSAAQPTHDNEESPSSSSIIIEEREAPPIVSTSDD